MKIYTGIGSRETPYEILQLMKELARLMSECFILRSGGADGADSAFESGCSGLKEIYLPWKNFNNNTSSLYRISPEATTLAQKIHPNWNKCSEGARKLHSRNCMQILGVDLKTPTDIVVCWTPGGKDVGGTSQAIRLARLNSIPVYNLYTKSGDHSNLYVDRVYRNILDTLPRF